MKYSRIAGFLKVWAKAFSENLLPRDSNPDFPLSSLKSPPCLSQLWQANTDNTSIAHCHQAQQPLTPRVHLIQQRSHISVISRM